MIKSTKNGVVLLLFLCSEASLAGVTDGLVSNFQFEENTQNSANSLHGLVYGNVEYTEGHKGKAIACNNGGVTTLTSYFDKDWVYNRPEGTAYHHTIPNQSNPQTLSVWFKTTDYNTTDWGGLIAGISSNSSRIYIAVKQNFLVITYGGDADLVTKELSSLIVNDGLWHHVAIVSHGDVEEKEVYFDGELKLSFNGGHNANTSEGYYRICGYTLYNGSYKNHYHGQVDDFRIYKRALSLDEIQTLYQIDNAENECWATYENGLVHIPCLKVKMPLGDDLKFSVDMQYKPLSEPMSFELTGAQPK